MKRQDKIAVLIDAENVSKKYIKLIMDEVNEFGTPTYKRVYDDFSNPSVSSWKDVLLIYTIKQSNGINQQEVITVDNTKKALIK